MLSRDDEPVEPVWELTMEHTVRTLGHMGTTLVVGCLSTRSRSGHVIHGAHLKRNEWKPHSVGVHSDVYGVLNVSSEHDYSFVTGTQRGDGWIALSSGELMRINVGTEEQAPVVYPHKHVIGGQPWALAQLPRAKCLDASPGKGWLYAASSVVTRVRWTIGDTDGGADGGAPVTDGSTRDVLALPESIGSVYTLCLDERHNTLWVGDSYGDVILIDVLLWSQSHRWKPHNKTVRAAVWAEVPDYMCTASYDATVKVWQHKGPQTGVQAAASHGNPYKQVASLGPLSSDVNCLAATRRLLAAGCDDDKVYVISLHSFTVLQELCSHDDFVLAVAFLGPNLWSGGSDKKLIVWRGFERFAEWSLCIKECVTLVLCHRAAKRNPGVCDHLAEMPKDVVIGILCAFIQSPPYPQQRQ